jgi:hypothetical protein
MRSESQQDFHDQPLAAAASRLLLFWLRQCELQGAVVATTVSPIRTACHRRYSLRLLGVNLSGRLSARCAQKQQEVWLYSHTLSHAYGWMMFFLVYVVCCTMIRHSHQWNRLCLYDAVAGRPPASHAGGVLHCSNDVWVFNSVADLQLKSTLQSAGICMS